MKKHFVKFYSPGTFVHEETVEEIQSWDEDLAVGMSSNIIERHAATPFGFRFFTKERSDEDLDSRISEESGMFYLGGDVYTLEQMKEMNNPDDKILIRNMECNKWDKVIINTNSWKVCQPLFKNDVVLSI